MTSLRERVGGDSQLGPAIEAQLSAQLGARPPPGLEAHHNRSFRTSAQAMREHKAMTHSGAHPYRCAGVRGVRGGGGGGGRRRRV